MSTARGVRLFSGGLLFALVLASVAEAQQGSIITGRVTDQASGQPVEAARVLVVGRQIAVATDGDGRYTLRGIPAGQVQIRVMRLAYQPQEQTVTAVPGQEVTLDFALEKAVAQLDAVVTTMTGEAAARELGFSVGRIQAEQVAQQAPIKSMGELLQGRVAGVQVLSGNITGQGSRVRIRGVSSLSLSNNPIYIIDGIRMESATGSSSIGVGGSLPDRVSDINPEEIESIEVVKGPAAATLYGTDAANGVIMIRTKRGVAGRPQWTFYAERGIIEDRNDYPVAYTHFGRRTSNGAVTDQCWNSRISTNWCTPDSLLTYNLFEDPNVSPIGTGDRAQYGAQVRGGSENVQYFVSGEAEDETGVYELPPFELARYERNNIAVRRDWMHPNALRKANARANVDIKLTDRADLRVSTAYVQSYHRMLQTDNNVTGLFSSGYGGPGYAWRTNNLGDTLYGYRAYTPGDIFQHTVSQNINRFIGGLAGNWRPTGWLVGRANLGLDFTHRLDSQICRFQTCTAFSTRRLGFKEDNRTQFYQYTIDVGGTGTFELTDAITSRTTLGGQFFRGVFDRNGAFGSRLPPGATQVSDAAVLSAEETTSESRTLGFFLEQGFDYENRLFLTLGLRGDDNSAFGADFGAVYYPKASLSWVVSEEPFFPSSSWLSTLRLRGAIGASGVQPGTTDAVPYFSGVIVRESGVEEPGVVFSALGNRDLKPERTTEWEAGVDLSLLDNRVNLELAYYDKTSSDALVERILPPSLGTGSTDRFENLGEVRNWGWEWLVNATPIDLPQVSVDFSVSGSHNSNELVDLGGVPPIIGAVTAAKEGYPLWGVWQRPILGYSDANADGILTADEVQVGDTAVFLGYSIPRTEMTFSGGVEFLRRMFRLAALVDYKGGHLLRNGTERIRCDNRINCRGLMDPSAPLWEQARVIAMKEADVRTEAGYSEDGAFFRFREISLTFRAPEEWAQRWLRGSGLTATVAARNLGVLTDYTGIDPESNYATGDVQTDFQTAPPPSYFTFRLSISY